MKQVTRLVLVGGAAAVSSAGAIAIGSTGVVGLYVHVTLHAHPLPHFWGEHCRCARRCAAEGLTLR